MYKLPMYIYGGEMHLPSSCALFSSSSSVSILHVHSTIHCLVASPHSYKSDITLISCNLLSSFTWTHKNMCTSGLCFMYSCHNSFSLLRLTPMHDAMHLPSRMRMIGLVCKTRPPSAGLVHFELILTVTQFLDREQTNGESLHQCIALKWPLLSDRFNHWIS